MDVSSDVKKKPPPKKRIEVEEDAAKGDGDTSFDEAPVKRKPVRVRPPICVPSPQLLATQALAFLSLSA